MITAKQARQVSKTAPSRMLDNELSSLEFLITEQAEQGVNDLFVNSLSGRARQALTTQGYTVERSSRGWYMSEYVEMGWVISW